MKIETYEAIERCRAIFPNNNIINVKEYNDVLVIQDKVSGWQSAPDFVFEELIECGIQLGDSSHHLLIYFYKNIWLSKDASLATFNLPNYKFVPISAIGYKGNKKNILYIHPSSVKKLKEALPD